MTDSPKNSVQIYVINLDRSTDRLAQISQQLAAHQLAFERIAAVDGKQASPAQQALLDEEAYQRLHGKSSLPGELGCYLSHVNAIHAFLATDKKYAVVLEDDAILQSEFASLINSLVDHAEDWDMVKLSGVHSGTPVSVLPLFGNHDLCVMFSKCTCSSAYILNRKAANAYAKGLLPMVLPYDHEFDKGWKYDIKVRALRPFPVTHNESAATTIVAPVAVRRKLPGLQRLPAHMYRLKTEFARLRYALRQYIAAQR